jgi:hypothetical protein
MKNKFKCPYCNCKIKTTNENIFPISLDHFLPKSLFYTTWQKADKLNISKHINKNMIACCLKCNQIKSSHVFWSIESVSEFIKFKKETGKNYKKWLEFKLGDKNIVKIFIFMQQTIKDLRNRLNTLNRKKGK